MSNRERYAQSIAARDGEVKALLASPPFNGWKASFMRMSAVFCRKAGERKLASIYKQAAQRLERAA